MFLVHLLSSPILTFTEIVDKHVTLYAVLVNKTFIIS